MNPVATFMDYRAIFGPEGVLARSHPHFEYRESQITMAEAVDAAIRERRHLCVEAGTGTGKTLAYLFPAIAARKRTVISTATRALQEQLFFKDIPFLQRSAVPDLKAVCMKGRGNYLCLKKLQAHVENPALLHTERAETLDRIAQWSGETPAGDFAELEFLRENDPLWKQLDARRETCLGQKCSQYDPCFITRLRQEALSADLIVVNHSLFFADLALRRQGVASVLPDYSVVIFDEAHDIEDVATPFFGRQVSSYRIEDFDRDLAREFQHEPAVLRTAGKLLDASRLLLEACCARGGDFRGSMTGVARRPDFQSLAERALDVWRMLLAQVGKMNSRTDAQQALGTRAEELLADLAFLSGADDGGFVFWVERRGMGIFLNASPIDLGPILSEALFSEPVCCVLTSATLSTGGSFSYIQGRLGIADAEGLILESEFDLARQTTLYIPRLPDPRHPDYLELACGEIQSLLQISKGRAFLLFTSFAQMERCYERLSPVLEFPLLKQGDLPKGRLLEKFRTTGSAVLFATTSFWQGVDVQGDALSCVIIDKLPFAVPTDPVVEARLQYLEKQGKNAFVEYSVPQAIILLKQGLGRLIRSRRDRGILSILDSRILTRSYGRQFLESLPKCPVIDNIEDLSNFFDLA